MWESVVSILYSFRSWLHDWQTLIGAFAGAFLAGLIGWGAALFVSRRAERRIDRRNVAMVSSGLSSFVECIRALQVSHDVTMMGKFNKAEEVDAEGRRILTLFGADLLEIGPKYDFEQALWDLLVLTPDAMGTKLHSFHVKASAYKRNLDGLNRSTLVGARVVASMAHVSIAWNCLKAAEVASIVTPNLEKWATRKRLM